MNAIHVHPWINLTILSCKAVHTCTTAVGLLNMFVCEKLYIMNAIHFHPWIHLTISFLQSSTYMYHCSGVAKYVFM